MARASVGPSNMHRRTLLAAGGLTLAGGLAGCSAALVPDSDDRTVQAATPAPGQCEPAAEYRPTPDDADARPYPTLPSTVAATSAESFATAHERAYRYNSRLPEYGSVQVELDAPEWAVSPADGGFLVGHDGRVQFDEPKTPSGDATPRPSGFFEYTVWYYVTDRFALRGEEADGGLEQASAPDLVDAVPVACADDG